MKTLIQHLISVKLTKRKLKKSYSSSSFFVEISYKISRLYILKLKIRMTIFVKYLICNIKIRNFNTYFAKVIQNKI